MIPRPKKGLCFAVIGDVHFVDLIIFVVVVVVVFVVFAVIGVVVICRARPGRVPEPG